MKLSEIFDIVRGQSKYTKKYGQLNTGSYPVYSASVDMPLTYIETYDYDGEFLSFTTNGFAGHTKILNGKFSINADRGLLIPKTPVYLPYFKYILQPIFRSLSVGRLLKGGKGEYTKLHPYMIEDIDLELELDISKQKEIVSAYKTVEEFKNELSSYKNELKNNTIAIEPLEEFTYKNVSIGDIFNIVKGNSKYTKKYIQEHNGVYPVYSSQTINNGEIGYINSYDFNCYCITWTTDGIHAGTVFIRNDKFSMTTHCGALIPKEKIDLEYVYYMLKYSLKDYAVGDGNKRVTVDIINNVSIKVPIDTDNNFDFKKQKEIIKYYHNTEAKLNELELMKKEVLNSIDLLIKKEPSILK